MSDTKWPWWAIDGEALMDMLKRVAAGDTPELVYLEAYANSDVTDYGKPAE